MFWKGSESKRFVPEDESPRTRRTPRSSEKSRRASSPIGRPPHRNRDSRNISGQSSGSSSNDRSTPKIRVSSSNMDKGSASPGIVDRKPNVPYPSFSKAHSREAVHNREDVLRPPRSPITPESTEVNNGRSRKSASPRDRPRTSSGRLPPSPPLTTVDPNLPRASSDSGPHAFVEDLPSHSKSVKRTGSNSPNKTLRFSASRNSLRDAEEGRRSPRGFREASRSNDVDGARPSQDTRNLPSRYKGYSGNGSRPRSTVSRQNADANSTPITPATPVIEVFASYGSESDFGGTAVPLMGSTLTPPPPPPPPPDIGNIPLPKIDYLLQTGGIAKTVPRTFTSISYNTDLQSSSDAHVAAAFQPYYNLLSDYEQVLLKNGSIAVATGYESVASQLSERLESAFSRKTTTDVCTCVMCRDRRLQNNKDDGPTSWGEVLENISGRRTLPIWPPFSLSSMANGSGVVDLERQPPMQVLDLDVPDDLREHYVKQSKKTKQSVQNWLEAQSEDNRSPPSEVDNETLIFAILTYIEPENRKLYNALVKGLSIVPDSRAPTPLSTEPKSDFLQATGLALQRLYRLPKFPREPEIALFLLQNPLIHDVLATLASITKSEWEILLSGRFEKFLWNKGEDQKPNRSGTETLAQKSSNGTIAIPGAWSPLGDVTPMSSSASPIKEGVSLSASRPGVVSADEDTEINVLAQVEREIYQGMELLENGLELLHQKAETVRAALRERSAGLARVQAQRTQEIVDVRLGTPAVGTGLFGGADNASEVQPGWPAPSDDGIGDERSELWPDDSASNIGHRSKHRHRRRKERRTPAPLYEED